MDRTLTSLIALVAVMGAGCTLEAAFARHWSSVNGLPGIDSNATRWWSIGSELPDVEYFPPLSCPGIDRNATTTTARASRNSVSSPNSAVAPTPIEVTPRADDRTGVRQSEEMSVTLAPNAPPFFRGDNEVSTVVRAVYSRQGSGITARAAAVTPLTRTPSPFAPERARPTSRYRWSHDKTMLMGRRMESATNADDA